MKRFTNASSIRKELTTVLSKAGLISGLDAATSQHDFASACARALHDVVRKLVMRARHSHRILIISATVESVIREAWNTHTTRLSDQ